MIHLVLVIFSYVSVGHTAIDQFNGPNLHPGSEFSFLTKNSKPDFGALIPQRCRVRQPRLELALRGGSLSRSLITAARTSSQPSISRIRRPSPSYLLDPRRPFIALPRSMGLLGCTQSLLPMHSAIAETHLTSHLSIQSRASCELSQGT